MQQKKLTTVWMLGSHHLHCSEENAETTKTEPQKSSTKLKVSNNCIETCKFNCVEIIDFDNAKSKLGNCYEI